MYSIEKYTYEVPAFPKKGQDPEEEVRVLCWRKYGRNWKEAVDAVEELDGPDIHWEHKSDYSHGLCVKNFSHYYVKRVDIPPEV